MTEAPRQAKVEAALACILQAFFDYNASFSDITARAKRRFIQADRSGMNQDINERYALYDAAIYEVINKLEQILGERLFSKPIWVELRGAYLEKISALPDAKFYQTFFNTLSRRLFKTTGVDPAIEFTVADQLDSQSSSEAMTPAEIGFFQIDPTDHNALAFWLSEMTTDWPMADFGDQIREVANRLQQAYGSGSMACIEIEMLRVPFYRQGRAYCVGRVLSGTGDIRPIVFAFGSNGEAVYLEAILTKTQQVSILFGYTFNYFMVDVLIVEPIVQFLGAILPSKPKAELYTVLGRVKQGKTERYQSFFAHLLGESAGQLVEAEGKKGMVMLVFTLPSYPLVFKLIRDRFAPSKQVTRSEVQERYHLVFRHDRVGRLIDAQEFRELKIPLSAVSEPLHKVLLTECSRLVECTGDELLIHHCYVERRVRPLDLYLAEAKESDALKAVLDYGQAIKDLARSNIFAGDLLPKNFGVTGSGRVVFYDYDELRLMSECCFRHWPNSDDDVMSMSNEPWFYVGEDDVFPEQFPLFMGLSPNRLAHLRAHHQDLFDADWWVSVQKRIEQSHAFDVPPFTSEARLDLA